MSSDEELMNIADELTKIRKELSGGVNVMVEAGIIEAAIDRLALAIALGNAGGDRAPHDELLADLQARVAKTRKRS